MRSYDPTSEFDRDEAARLGAEKWQLDLLKLNPAYVSWGPHEDYMWRLGSDEKDLDGNPGPGGWQARIMRKTWADFDLHLDELNEVVNFYFSVERASETCTDCGGTGYHPVALWVSESFYQHSTPFRAQTPRQAEGEAVLRRFGVKPVRPLGKAEDGYPSPATLAKYGPAFAAFCAEMVEHGAWHDRITADEFEALREHSRHRGHASPEECNEAERSVGSGHGFFGHDTINRGILIERRLARLGIPGQCPACKGEGAVYTAPKPSVALTLWVIHPRKGAARGLEVAEIRQDQLPDVYTFLRAAAARNAERFARIPNPTEAPPKARRRRKGVK